ncbi:MAG: membrane dipeptidase, partial [Clostridia bacterium]|nr:membrane dipeptidase [Clostridia bacterium]
EKNKITICKSYDEIINNKDRVKAILSLEGGEPIETLSDLDYIKSRGVLMVAPTWNYKNQLGCGVLEKEDTGLTEFGKKAVRRMNDLGILIDVSHLSEKSFWDVTEISTKPICASHSDSKAVKDNPRNLTDAQFCKIRDMNGCVGINFYPPFLGDDIKCVIDHIDRFLSLGGEDNIGIGSDFDGVDRLPDGISGCQDMEKVIKMLPYSEKIRKKIAFENFLRVLSAQNC